MVTYSNIPSACDDLFSFLNKDDSFSGYVFGANFNTDEEFFYYLYTIIFDLESHIRETTNTTLLLSHDKYSFWVKIVAYPEQDKFTFIRVFKNH